MKVHIRTNQLIHIIDIEGDIYLADAAHLKELVMTMIDKKVERLIINAEKIGTIDSSGIGALTFISSTIKKLGMELAIAHVSKELEQIMDKTRLLSYFSIYKDEDEAIREILKKQSIV